MVEGRPYFFTLSFDSYTHATMHTKSVNQSIINQCKDKNGNKPGTLLLYWLVLRLFSVLEPGVSVGWVAVDKSEGEVPRLLWMFGVKLCLLPCTPRQHVSRDMAHRGHHRLHMWERALTVSTIWP